MSNNVLIIAIAAIGTALIVAFVAIVLLYDGDKSLAIAGLVTVAGLSIPQLLSLKSSTDNAKRIAQVGRDVDSNTVTTDLTHQIVNSRMDQLIATVKQLAATQEALAAAQGEKRGIAIGRGQEAEDSTRHDAP